ncbi:MAG: hypothetical protein N4A49_16605 [Marinifilaceae bacterium]|nr:hypothetical protein [Marinifilaceae bacterium]
MNIISKITKIYKLFLLVIIYFCSSGVGLAQENDSQISYGVKLDTNAILIGDQINMRLFVNQNPSLKIKFPVLSDSISKNVEIVKSFNQDTVKLEDGKIQVGKNYVITSFEKGPHKINPFEFAIQYNNDLKSFRTDTTLILVNSFQIDTTKAHYDIVEPREAPLTWDEAVHYILIGVGILLALIIITLAVLYFVYKRKKKPIFSKPEIKEPPHVIAFRELDRIKTEKLWQNGFIKEFHSEITRVLREYIDYKYDLNTIESTTDETLDQVRAELGESVWFNDLKTVLERADLAKFAKMQPLPNENEESFIKSFGIVETSTKESLKEESEKEIKETDNSSSVKKDKFTDV